MPYGREIPREMDAMHPQITRTVRDIAHRWQGVAQESLRVCDHADAY
jgi:hypothetical protein